MNRRTPFALLGAILLALAVPAGALAAGPAVTVRIEGKGKTLVVPTTVHAHSGFITKFGAPGGKCPDKTAQGALDVATHGHWSGTWNSQFNEYFINSILGEKPPGHDFWDIFVDNKPAQLGACDLNLHAGEQVLFADESGKVNPASLTAPHTAMVGKPFRVKLVGYNAKGAAKPLAGVLITGNGGIIPVKTDRQGNANVIAPSVGKVVLRAGPKGYVRTEAVVRISA